MSKYIIRDVLASDERPVCKIANYHIKNTYASFHPTPADKKYFEGLIKMTKQHAFIVLLHEGQLIGYAFLSPLRPSKLFDRVARVGIFLDQEHTGKGLGALLMSALNDKAETLGIESLISTIASVNEPSLKFHAAQGFEKAGCLKKVGRKFGEYFDEILMQKML